ncbi:MAG TPA: insulinase family protein, partial [Bacteroidetes bacterium]|nr:insulinase family protein [Bacteroidota bacterium]
GQTRDEEARKKIQKEINDNAVAAAEFAVPNEFDRMLAGIGGQSVNAFTSEEMIVYHNYFPPNQVEKWLDIYSERFINPVFRLFQSELETVYEEKNRAMDNFIFALLHNFNKNLYKNHPYGQQDLIGSTEHLKNPSLTKMYEYFEQYYVSNNMALILSGDFDAAKVMPLIKAKFGRLKRGTVPPFPEYKEAPFAGRELVVGRYTPVAAALIGFRTVPVGHRDGPALDVVNYFLSNNGGTGLLDRLSLDQKILVSQLNTMRYADHGASMLVVVPKIIGQSIKKAEKLVLEEIEKLHRGEITQAQLTAAKLNLKQEFELEMEGLKSKALRVTNSFISGEPWENVVAYPSQIEKVSLERIAEVSKKYYGKNYLILQSKMGFPKKDKLSKPPYSPPIPKTTTKSAYAKHFDQLPSGTSQPHFVDFNTDVQQIQLADHAHLFRVENPSNNVFRLKFRYSIGKNSDPTLAYVAEYMGYLGTESQSTSEIRS